MSAESPLPAIHHLRLSGVIDALLDMSIIEPDISIGQIEKDGKVRLYDPFRKPHERYTVSGLDLEGFEVGDWCVIANTPTSTPPYF